MIEDEDLEFSIRSLKILDKPKFVRVNSSQFNRFVNTNVNWSGYVPMSKIPAIGDNNYDQILVELTPQLKDLLKQIYKGK